MFFLPLLCLKLLIKFIMNPKKDFSFYENFNTDTKAPNGVAFCAWSAAATVLIHQSLHNNFKIIF